LLRVGAARAAAGCTPAVRLKSGLLGRRAAAPVKLIHYFLAFSVVASEAASSNFCF